MKYGSISYARILEMNVRASMLFMLFWMVCFLAPASADERILDFHSDIRIEQNGDLVVTETIKVRSEGDRIKRGIYRDFPRFLSRGDDGKLRVGFEILSARRNGTSEAWHRARAGDFTRIYIGENDRFIASGKHIYELKYRTNRQLRFFETHDELFWNVTGTKWEFPIDHASAMITLPANIKAYETIYFTGTKGSRQKFAKSELLQHGQRISFETTRPLGLYENLTIGIKMPVNSFPLAQTRYFDLLEDNRGEFVLGGGLLALIIFYLISWRLVGRDPDRGVAVPRWDVSDAVSPALVYYVQHKGVIEDSVRALSAALISLAVKNLIHLGKLNKIPQINRTRHKARTDLPVGERAILGLIEEQPEQSLSLGIDTRKTQSIMLQRFVSSLEHEHRKIYFRNNRKFILGGILFSIICMIAALFTGGVDDETFALMVPAGAFGLFTTLVSARLIRDFSAGQSLWSRIVVITIGVTVIVPLILAILVYFLYSTIELEQPILIGLVVATLTIHTLFYYLMGAPTPLGRKTMDYIAGLETYLSLVEEDRLNLQRKPRLTPQHFEQLLPYAIALDLEKPWTQYFGSWLDHAMAFEELEADYEPDWIEFSSDNDEHSMSRAFAEFHRDLEKSISTSTSLAHLSDDGSSPNNNHSSGFSGGGSSGGGGGGGGGGGW